MYLLAIVFLVSYILNYNMDAPLVLGSLFAAWLDFFMYHYK